MLLLSKCDLVDKVTSAVFDRPLVTNSLRSLLVEAMIDEVLAPDWLWCSADYAAWDFEHPKGSRLEVKQSAARQSWTTGANGYSSPRFDIRERKFRWDGATKINEEGRFADLYVFAFHPGIGDEADHREASQWEFYAVRSEDLPRQATIGLGSIRKLAVPVGLAGLRNTVDDLLAN